MTEAPPAAKRERSPAKFYIAAGACLALLAFGVWFWRAWNVWWFDADEAARRQAEAAAELGLPVEISVDLPPSPSGYGAASGDGAKLELVFIPSGRFRMGSPPGEARWADETQHWVMVTRSFYIGKCEVTQEQWQHVIGGPIFPIIKGPKIAMENVCWESCEEFFKRLNRRALQPVKGKGSSPHAGPLPPGGGGAYAEWEFRLPTEAEWEWACRAGTRTRFCWGDDEAGSADYAWGGANSGGTPHPVGGKKPNAWGLHDMHGNVCEICQDWYGPYEQRLSGWGREDDPRGPRTGPNRVVRGGDWNGVWGSASRCGDISDMGCDFGLRVVLAPVSERNSP